MSEAGERRGKEEERKTVLADEAEEFQRKRDMEVGVAEQVREFELEKLRLKIDAKRLIFEQQLEERHIDRRFYLI